MAGFCAGRTGSGVRPGPGGGPGGTGPGQGGVGPGGSGSGGHGQSGEPCVRGVIINDPPAPVLPVESPALPATQAGSRSPPHSVPASTPARPHHPFPAGPRPTVTSPSAPPPRSATAPPTCAAPSGPRPAGAARQTSAAAPSPETPASPARPNRPAHRSRDRPRNRPAYEADLAPARASYIQRYLEFEIQPPVYAQS